MMPGMEVTYRPLYWACWHALRAKMAIQAGVSVLPDEIRFVDLDGNRVLIIVPYYEN